LIILKKISDIHIPGLVAQIEALPDLLLKSIEGLSEEQLDCSYRPGGWTLKQVVHHIADSQLNGYMRFRLALTDIKAIYIYPLNKNFRDILTRPD